MVFNMVFCGQEYECLSDLRSIENIVDLGANCGFSGVALLHLFPESRLIAVEPDPRNFEVCSRNLSAYGGRVEMLKGAVWDQCGLLSLETGVYRDGKEWSSRVHRASPENPGDVAAYDMYEIMQIGGFRTIDLLKVDIEGAERVVFGGLRRGWLDCVRNICIELHDADCKSAFIDSMSFFECDMSFAGELTIFRNIRVKDGA
ncbi:hypothetical protein ASA1KI_38940 [Opitutales bacterium ASA1]|uniref:FkbM family methyltransferase n=1 Tax=Congregicoccus parvus TaxID=3081749 RepID=UPI002B299AB8|nr:hypothetical protein ASA1KI_38940 [Opitutales bacterium ASA1]